MVEKCGVIRLKDGLPCRVGKVQGYDTCFFHLEPEIRKGFMGRILTREQRIVIINRQLKRLKGFKCNELEKSREIRSLMETLKNLEGGVEIKNDKENPVEDILKKWKKDKGQI